MAYKVFQLPYRLIGDDSDPIRTQKNFEAISDAIAQIQLYENATGIAVNQLLNNTVADERLGAQIAGFKRVGVAYKLDGTQVATHLPRYEYGAFYPAIPDDRAVMIEEGTTNVLLQSEAFDAANWVKVGTPVITANSTVAPNGTTTADTVEDTSTTAYDNVNQSVTAANSETWTASLFIKKDTNTARFPELGLDFVNGTTPVYYRIQLNTSTGAITTRLNGADAKVTVKEINGYWRLTITGTNNATGNTTVRLLFHPAVTTVWGSAEATAIGSCVIWGAQLEKKPYPTSYMATTTAAATRAAETLTIPTAGVFTKGNWAVELSFTPKITDYPYKYDYLWECYIDASNFYVLRVNYTTGYIALYVVSGGVTKGIVGASAVVVDTDYKIAASGNGSVMRLCVNGVQIGSDLAYVEPVGTLPVNMYIGSSHSGVAQANGFIDDLRISSRDRTLREHYDGYTSGLPLAVDDVTTLKMDFDSTLRQTTRRHIAREQGTFMVADASTTLDPTKATHIVPPGWTSAQTTFLQAISELPSTGGKIVAMDGTFVVDDYCKLSNNISIIGSGTNTVIKIASGINVGILVFQMDGLSGVTIQDLTLDGNKANRSISAMVLDIGIYGSSTGVSNCVISNVTSKNFFKDGMWIKALSGVSLVSCNCINNGVKGIALSGPVLVSNCECSNNGWDGISVAEGSLCTINGCRVYNNSNRGIDLYISTNVTVNNCDIDQNKYDGLRLMASSHCIISGNRIEDNGKNIDNTYSGIYVTSSGATGSGYNSIQNNRIRKGTSPTQKYGIVITDTYCTRNVVTNNDMYSSGVTASFSDGGTSTVTTAGNRL